MSEHLFLFQIFFDNIEAQYLHLLYHSVFFHHRSRSRSPRRRKRSPTPRPTKVHVGKLTRNVNKEHLSEIFNVYGQIKEVEMLKDRSHPEFSRGFAYIVYGSPDDAEKAIKHMDGGECDACSRSLLLL